jgi:hypothetical protein
LAALLAGLADFWTSSSRTERAGQQMRCSTMLLHVRAT